MEVDSVQLDTSIDGTRRQDRAVEDEISDQVVSPSLSTHRLVALRGSNGIQYPRRRQIGLPKQYHRLKRISLPGLEDNRIAHHARDYTLTTHHLYSALSYDISASETYRSLGRFSISLFALRGVYAKRKYSHPTQLAITNQAVVGISKGTRYL